MLVAAQGSDAIGSIGDSLASLTTTDRRRQLRLSLFPCDYVCIKVSQLCALHLYRLHLQTMEPLPSAMAAAAAVGGGGGGGEWWRLAVASGWGHL